MLILVTDGWVIAGEIALMWLSLNLTNDNSTLHGSVNGLVPSNNKPLPEPLLTQFYVAIWRH